MKKGCGCIVLIVVILLIGVLWGTKVYNTLVTEREQVKTAWSNVESTYQRRADLIPNLVETVKGYATHEQETLEGVIEARARATQATIDADNLTAENMQNYQEAQSGLTSALGKLLMIREDYPELKANENFLELQSQLEGCENRINVARNTFNDAAKSYNTKIQRFPASVVASLFRFKEFSYFTASDGADVAPTVTF